MMCSMLQAYKYQEDYQLALTGFARALALDPTWNLPKQQERELTEYLSHVHDLMQRKVQYVTGSRRPSRTSPRPGVANQSETKSHIFYCVTAKSHIIHMGTHEHHPIPSSLTHTHRPLLSQIYCKCHTPT